MYKLYKNDSGRSGQRLLKVRCAMIQSEDAIKAIQTMIEKNKYRARYEEDSEIATKCQKENEVLQLAMDALREKLARENLQVG